MRTLAIPPKAPGIGPTPATFTRHLRPAGRFFLHLAEMCMVMCAGGVGLSVLFFGTASLLGYQNLPQQAPELSVLVVAINLSLPMALWMRFRGMAWRPTVEMSGSTMILGLLLITAYWMDLIARDSLIETQAGAACPLMLGIMLLRPRLYASHHAVHRKEHSATGDGPLPRSLARFNRKFANPVVRRFAGSFGPLTLLRHRGRRTGRAYATPVLSFATDDGLLVAVLYGRRSDWVRNVVASGSLEAKRHGLTREYESARLVGRDEAIQLLPAIARGAFRVLGARDFVRLTESRPSR